MSKRKSVRNGFESKAGMGFAGADLPSYGGDYDSLRERTFTLLEQSTGIPRAALDLWVREESAMAWATNSTNSGGNINGGRFESPLDRGERAMRIAAHAARVEEEEKGYSAESPESGAFASLAVGFPRRRGGWVSLKEGGVEITHWEGEHYLDEYLNEGGTRVEEEDVYTSGRGVAYHAEAMLPPDSGERRKLAIGSQRTPQLGVYEWMKMPLASGEEPAPMGRDAILALLMEGKISKADALKYL